MIYRVTHKDKILKGEITLPSSKSECNRILMIKAISGLDIEIKNISTAKDTQTLIDILEKDKQKHKFPTAPIFDVGHAGTTMRFLTAYFAATPGERILTGSERMLKRPIGELVEALRKLGADIEYLGEKGFPPLKINGDEIHGGEISINGSVSSQFISALLMIAPLLQRGLVLNFTGDLISVPYIKMTMSMMEMYGVFGSWENKIIHYSPQKYKLEDEENKTYIIEGDWSSASYVFSFVSLSKEADLTVKSLKPDSIQGDAVVKNLFDFFAVKNSWEKDNTIRINKVPLLAKQFHFDFEDCPDLAQTVAVAAAAHGVKSVFMGLSTLRVKETDRLSALKNELAKLNVKVEIIGNEGMLIDASNFSKIPKAPIATYHDHRMALSFAPLALVCDYIDIEYPEVVEKSYPNYWEELRKVGFTVEELN